MFLLFFGSAGQTLGFAAWGLRLRFRVFRVFRVFSI